MSDTIASPFQHFCSRCDEWNNLYARMTHVQMNVCTFELKGAKNAFNLRVHPIWEEIHLDGGKKNNMYRFCLDAQILLSWIYCKIR